MAKHKMLVDLPAAEILNKDAEFVVRADDRKLGTLTVSRGGIGWYPHKGLERHLRWEEFDRLMREG